GLINFQSNQGFLLWAKHEPRTERSIKLPRRQTTSQRAIAAAPCGRGPTVIISSCNWQHIRWAIQELLRANTRSAELCTTEMNPDFSIGKSPCSRRHSVFWIGPVGKAAHIVAIPLLTGMVGSSPRAHAQTKDALPTNCAGLRVTLKSEIDRMR